MKTESYNIAFRKCRANSKRYKFIKGFEGVLDLVAQVNKTYLHQRLKFIILN